MQRQLPAQVPETAKQAGEARPQADAEPSDETKRMLTALDSQVNRRRPAHAPVVLQPRMGALPASGPCAGPASPA